MARRYRTVTVVALRIIFLLAGNERFQCDFRIFFE